MGKAFALLPTMVSFTVVCCPAVQEDRSCTISEPGRAQRALLQWEVHYPWKLPTEVLPPPKVIKSHLSVIKSRSTNAGDKGLIPLLEKSPGEENGNPLQYSYLEIPRSERPGSPWGHTEANTTW